jgi:hypothetical protein
MGMDTRSHELFVDAVFGGGLKKGINGVNGVAF